MNDLWLVSAYYLFAGLLIVFIMSLIKGVAHAPWRCEEGDATDQMGYEQDEFGSKAHPGLDQAGYEEYPATENPNVNHPHVEALGH